MYKSADNLNKHKSRGDKITHGEWNAIARAVGMDKELPGFYGDESSAAQSHNAQGKRLWVRVYSTEGIDPYSVFGVVAGQTNDEYAPKATIEKFSIASAASLGAILTNGSQPILTDSWGWAHVVDSWYPTLLLSASAIPIGKFCGPSLDAPVVAANRLGLMAVSNRDDEDRQWFLGTNEPTGIVGKAVGSISAYDDTTDTLGTGTIRVMYKQETTAILENITPNLDLPVFNACETTIASGTVVRAFPAMGVGLIVVACSGAAEPPPDPCVRTFNFPIAFELNTTTCDIEPVQWKIITFDEHGCITEEIVEEEPS